MLLVSSLLVICSPRFSFQLQEHCFCFPCINSISHRLGCSIIRTRSRFAVLHDIPTRTGIGSKFKLQRLVIERLFVPFHVTMVGPGVFRLVPFISVQITVLIFEGIVRVIFGCHARTALGGIGGEGKLRDGSIQAVTIRVLDKRHTGRKVGGIHSAGL